MGIQWIEILFPTLGGTTLGFSKNLDHLNETHFQALKEVMCMVESYNLSYLSLSKKEKDFKFLPNY